MKLSLFIGILLLLFVGCRKEEYFFSLHVRLGNSLDVPGTILLTDSKGNLLKTFEVSAGTKETDLEYKATSSIDQHPDVFLIVKNLHGFLQTNIWSQLDVISGSDIFLGPDYEWYQYRHTVKITGIQSFDSISTPDHQMSNNPAAFYDAAEQALYYTFSIQEQRGIRLDVLANQESASRSLLIPVNKLPSNDTVSVKWSDFGPDQQLSTIALPGNGMAINMQEDVLTTDGGGVVVGQQYLWNSRTFLPFQPEFLPQLALPSNVTADRPVAVKMAFDDVIVQKIFQAGSPITIAGPQMSIAYHKMLLNFVDVISEGSPDWIRITGTSYYHTGVDYEGVIYQLDGPPSVFSGHNLPDLTAFFPKNAIIEKNMNETVTSIIKFDNIAGQDIRIKYPFAKNDPYALAKSGYTEVWKLDD